jgi:hypothetical protein
MSITSGSRRASEKSYDFAVLVSIAVVVEANPSPPETRASHGRCDDRWNGERLRCQ